MMPMHVLITAASRRVPLVQALWVLSTFQYSV